MIDLHCHLLPGVDDGASDLAESVAMAKELERLGFTKVCATPHLFWGADALGPSDVAKRCRECEQALRREGVEMEVIAGAEHHAAMLAEILSQGRLVTYPRGDTFLMEFSLTGFPPRMEELLFLSRA